MTLDPWTTDVAVRTGPRLLGTDLSTQDVAGAIAQASSLLTEWTGRRYGTETVTRTFTPADVALLTCDSRSGLVLPSLAPGGRVERVVSLTVGGVALAEGVGWRLVQRERLEAVTGSWYGSGLGDLVVVYVRGRPPTPAGVEAATALASELLLDGLGDKRCRLSAAVRRVVRQGVTLERPSSSTGVPRVDAFLTAVNPRRVSRPATVASPDTIYGY